MSFHLPRRVLPDATRQKGLTVAAGLGEFVPAFGGRFGFAHMLWSTEHPAAGASRRPHPTALSLWMLKNHGISL